MVAVSQHLVGGVSTRRLDDLMQAMAVPGISTNSVYKLCREIDERGNGFLDHRLVGDWPYPWFDAAYLMQREGGGVVSVAVIIAVTVNTEGRREIVGMDCGAPEAETFRSTFLSSLVGRALRGVGLVIRDAHEGMTAVVWQMMGGSWQRCRVHCARNAPTYVSKAQQSMVSAALRQTFFDPDRAVASQALRHVGDQLRGDQLRPKWRTPASFLGETELDVLAKYRLFQPAQDPVPQHQPVATLEPGGRPPRGCCRYLPQRGRHHPPVWRCARQGQRRVADLEPLPADRADGGIHTAKYRCRTHHRLPPRALDLWPLQTSQFPEH